MTHHDIYSAFGNQVRTKLILCLANKQKNVTQLINTCTLSQSAVSQHLSKLKKSGIVEAKKDGKEVWYSLKYKKAADISKLLLSLEQEAAA
jgi:DNA-binding transcriptional ArsR family regulator